MTRLFHHAAAAFAAVLIAAVTIGSVVSVPSARATSIIAPVLA